MYDRDGAARAFLDIFQHRAVSLFHARPGASTACPSQYEAGPAASTSGPMALALAGLGLNGLAGSAARPPEGGGVADDAIAYYAGHLQQRVISARRPACSHILSDYFQLPRAR